MCARRELDRTVHVQQCFRERLPRQPVHQVQVEVREPRSAEFCDRGLDLAMRVDAAERREVKVIETLRPQRHAVDPGVAILGERAVLDRAGVRFQRNLETGSDRQQLACPLQDRGDGLRGEQARRAPAEEDRGDLASGQALGCVPEIVEQRGKVRVARDAGGGNGVRIEVAVRALAHAPRQVHVQGQRQAAARAHGSRTTPPSAATSARNARPRWLTRFFSAGSNSAAVRDGTLDDEQRVVAESAAATRHPADPPVPARLADDRRRVVRPAQVRHRAAVARRTLCVGHALEFEQQLAVVGLVVGGFAGIACRVDARRAVQRVDLEARIVGDGGQARCLALQSAP